MTLDEFAKSFIRPCQSRPQSPSPPLWSPKNKLKGKPFRDVSGIFRLGSRAWKSTLHKVSYLDLFRERSQWRFFSRKSFHLITIINRSIPPKNLVACSETALLNLHLPSATVKYLLFIQLSEKNIPNVAYCMTFERLAKKTARFVFANNYWKCECIAYTHVSILYLDVLTPGQGTVGIILKTSPYFLSDKPKKWWIPPQLLNLNFHTLWTFEQFLDFLTA